MTLPDTHGGAEVPSDDQPGVPDVTPGTAPDRRDLWNDLDQSSLMSVEFISAILVWGGLGLLLDRWVGTAPWLMGIGVLVGFSAGLYLVWLRSARALALARPATTTLDPADDDPATEGRSA
jgi:F0F1-type ATP synthase assembly protein I